MAEEMSGPSESAARLAPAESAQYMGQPQPPMASMAPYGRGPMRTKPIGQNGFNPCCCMSLRLGCYLLGGIPLVFNVITFCYNIAALSTDGAAAKGTMTMATDKTVVYVGLAATAFAILVDLLIIGAAKSLNRTLAMIYAVLISISALLDLVNAVLNFLKGAPLAGAGFFVRGAFNAYAASCGYGLYMQIRDGEYAMAAYNMAPPASY